MKKLSIITPVYNEEKTIPIFFEELLLFEKQISNYQLEWLIVDDGSLDATTEIINTLCNSQQFIRGVIFSRNFGKEAALFAGLEHSEGDIIKIGRASCRERG